MTTHVVRHAPTTYSLVYRVNGDPNVNVPVTSQGEEVCRSQPHSREIVTCVTSPFPRCQRTAALLVREEVPITIDVRLGELDYGEFEGGEFLEYARWLAEHGPYIRPPGARESQAGAIARMLIGLRAVLDHQGPRLVVVHGLLVSVIRWARAHPRAPLTDVFLHGAPSLTSVTLSDDELRDLTTHLLNNLGLAVRNQRRWRVDLGVFPREARSTLATVSTHAH